MFSKDKTAREGLERVEHKFEELEHRFKIMKLEWDEAYEKIGSALRKLGRRAEVLQKEMDGGKPPLSESEQVLADGTNGMHGRMLSAHQLEVQQKIMKRRGGG